MSVLDASPEKDKVVMLVLQQARMGQKDVCDGPAAGSDRATKDAVAGGGTAGSRCSCRSGSDIAAAVGDGLYARLEGAAVGARAAADRYVVGPAAGVDPVVKDAAAAAAKDAAGEQGAAGSQGSPKIILRL